MSRAPGCPPRLLGAVLAGGEGRRFGAPKADVSVGGVSLVRRAVETLAPAVDGVVVVSSRPVLDAPAPVVRDTVPDAGPLAALDAALAIATERALDGVFLLACDLPLVDCRLVGRIRDVLGEAAAVAPERARAGAETTCAVYHVRVASAVRARLSSEDRSLHALFRDVSGVPIPLAQLDAAEEDFLNVNTPDDRVLAEAALRSRTGPGPACRASRSGP